MKQPADLVIAARWVIPVEPDGVVLADHSVVVDGGRIVELKGAVNEKALVRALQWDVYGVDVLHVDFTRVSEHERIEVQVAHALPRPGQRGAPGRLHGVLAADTSVCYSTYRPDAMPPSLQATIDVLVIAAGNGPGGTGTTNSCASSNRPRNRRPGPVN